MDFGELRTHKWGLNPCATCRDKVKDNRDEEGACLSSAAIREYHRLGSLNNRNLFLTV